VVQAGALPPAKPDNHTKFEFAPLALSDLETIGDYDC
jgi:hypothetical protein